MFSKASDLWETPQVFFDELDAEFRFDCDAAASRENHKSVIWFGHGGGLDSLTTNWAPLTCFVNPPYSKCAEFVEKSAQEAKKGSTVVMLIPSRTDTRYWHEHIWDCGKHQPRPGVEIRFIKGRLKFGNSENSAPFPSVVVIFRPT